MVISPALIQLFESGFIVALVTLLVNIAAPFLERTGWCAPSSSVHDATLRALNLALNVGLSLGAAALLSQLANGQAALAVIGFGVAQATGSHLVYQSGNRPAPTPAPSVPAAPAPASPAPSLASIAAPTVAAVASAVNAAIAAQTS